MNKKEIFKWITIVSFCILLIGGINWLLVGLFKFDVFSSLFGGTEGVAARVFYSLFGFAALMLLTVIVIRMFTYGKTANKSKSEAAKSA